MKLVDKNEYKSPQSERNENPQEDDNNDFEEMPLLYVDVSLSSNLKSRIALYEGDDVAEIA